MATKISTGATRNLILKGVHSDITDERIRDDLEHIHNLVVVGLTFNNQDALVSLNSVHNALFARTCLMSRAKYKGLKIDFYPDECAQPLPATQRTPKATNAKPALKPKNSMVNRFQLLNMDGTEDSDSDVDSAEPPNFPAAPKWVANVVAV